jgi:hypothetical protein
VARLGPRLFHRGGPARAAKAFAPGPRRWCRVGDGGSDRKDQEADIELDRQAIDRLPFHDTEETEPAALGSAPSRDARIRHLQRVPLFSGFDESELRGVADLATIVEIPAGTVVPEMGKPGDAFFIIIDGTVVLRNPVMAGRQLQPGDFFGEMSLLDGEPRSATITASTDLRLLRVDRIHFWRLLEESPALSGGSSPSSRAGSGGWSRRWT